MTKESRVFLGRPDGKTSVLVCDGGFYPFAFTGEATSIQFSSLGSLIEVNCISVLVSRTGREIAYNIDGEFGIIQSGKMTPDLMATLGSLNPCLVGTNKGVSEGIGYTKSIYVYAPNVIDKVIVGESL